MPELNSREKIYRVGESRSEQCALSANHLAALSGSQIQAPGSAGGTVTKMGKPPALPGDSQSLTVPELGSILPLQLVNELMNAGSLCYYDMEIEYDLEFGSAS